QGALVDGEDDVGAGTGLLGELLLQQIHGLLGLGAGDLEVVDGRAAERLAPDRDADDGDHPEGEHEPAASGRTSTEAVQESGHSTASGRTRGQPTVSDSD